MKTRLLIIIISFVALILLWYFSAHSFTLDDEKFCEVHTGGFDTVIKCVYFDSDAVLQNNESSKSSLEQLQKILDYCDDDSDKYVANTRITYSNNTHYIDNFGCKWNMMKTQENDLAIDLTVHPGFDKNNLFKHKQLQDVLDHCERQELGLDVYLSYLQYENKTHIITNDTCEWREMDIHWNAGD